MRKLIDGKTVGGGLYLYGNKTVFIVPFTVCEVFSFYFWFLFLFKCVTRHFIFYFALFYILLAFLFEDSWHGFIDSYYLHILCCSHLHFDVSVLILNFHLIDDPLSVASGISCPALSASLAYYDSYRRANSPANLTQAQRDFFGAHTYNRTDRKGVFHTLWTEANSATKKT